MKRLLLRSGIPGWLIVAAAIVAARMVVPVRPVAAWLGDKLERITGKSVEVRTQDKSKRCARDIASIYRAARAAAGPPLDLEDRILHDQRSSKEFFAHPSPLGPDPAQAGDTVFYIDVFANHTARESLLRGAPVFPFGSVIVKRKSLAPDGVYTEYFTGMRKREAGYAPACGDWEFFVLNAQKEEVTTARLESCAECHQKWPEKDFVSRNYFDPALPGGIKSLIDEKKER